MATKRPSADAFLDDQTAGATGEKNLRDARPYPGARTYADRQRYAVTRDRRRHAVTSVLTLVFETATRVVRMQGASVRAAQTHPQPRSNNTSVRRGEHCIPHRSESCSTRRSPYPRRASSRVRAKCPGPWSSTAQRMFPLKHRSSITGTPCRFTPQFAVKSIGTAERFSAHDRRGKRWT